MATPELLAVSCKPENGAKNGGHAFLRSLRFFCVFDCPDQIFQKPQFLFVHKIEQYIDAFFTGIVCVHFWIKELIHRQVKHGHQLIENVEARMLAIVFISFYFHDITQCNFIFRVVVFKRFIISCYHIFNFVSII